MGLLTGLLTLLREPLRLTLRVWEFGLSTAAEAARVGADLLGPERGAHPPDRPDAWRPPEPAVDNGGSPEAGVTEAPTAPPSLADVPRPVADAPPAVPDELIPDHVDEEAVLVAEAAEEGAEDGAGAELHVDPPWDGYDRMTAADIRDRLSAGTAAQAAAVELYESMGKHRRTVLDAAERALKP